jgi:fatty acid desaturase
MHMPNLPNGGATPTPKEVIEFVKGAGLSQKANTPTHVRALTILAIYVTISGISIWVNHWALWGFGWMAQSAIIAGLFSVVHEASHGNLFRSKKLNRLGGLIASSLILMNFSLYRYFHLQHHKYTHVEGDTERLDRVSSLREYLQLINLLPVFLGFWIASAMSIFGTYPSYCQTELQRKRVRKDAFILAGASGSLGMLLWLWPGETLTLWLIPYILASAVVIPLAEVTNHTNCDVSGSYFERTRTVKSNCLFRFLYWNNNYHVEHHLCPTVPYFRLQTIHKFVRTRLQHYSPSYLGWHLALIRAGMRPRIKEITDTTGRGNSHCQKD